jgi:hypothetical protein
VKKLIATLVLVLFASSANAGLFCSAAKAFKYESDVLNGFCVQEMIFAAGGGWSD